MKRFITKAVVGAAVGGVALVASVLPAGATTFVDGYTGVLNTCNITSYGANSGTGQTQAYTYNNNACNITTCIRESYVSGGVAHWSSEACASGAFGQYAITPVVTGDYLGRQIRVGSSCWWDTLFDNPTPHACI